LAPLVEELAGDLRSKQETAPSARRAYLDACRGILARVALLRGQLEVAEREADAAMAKLAPLGPWRNETAAVRIRALFGMGRVAEAVAAAEQILGLIPPFGGAGFTEVEVRLSVAEAFKANSDHERARAELAETLRQVQLRLDDIPDRFWKNSYLTRNPH